MDKAQDPGSMTIFFYQVEAEYGCFSNFSPHGFTLDGVHWPTAEHYYQAHKFWGTDQTELFLAVQQAASPTAAAALGRNPQYQYQLRPDWEAVKLTVMHQAVWAKFQTHAMIRQILLDTQEQVIIEDSPVDSFWGCGADRQGQNHLGKVLMQVRQQLRQTVAADDTFKNG
jgi:N-glycosidase YbiA